MISILHILQQIPLFIDYIFKNKFTKNSIVYEIQLLFKESLENDNNIINPESFINAMGNIDERWISNEYQDSHDFLYSLLIEIQKETHLTCHILYGRNINRPIDISKFNLNFTDFHKLSSTNSEISYFTNEYSSIIDIFNGTMKYTKKCIYCGTSSDKYEKFMSINVEIPNITDRNISLYDCLDNYFIETQLDDDNYYMCNFCGIKNKAYNKSIIWKLPKILIIQLKRFNYNISTNSFTKNTASVNYPINLIMKKYISFKSINRKLYNYSLGAINIHKGSSKTIESGHYISIIKNKLNGNWNIYNDESNVTTIESDKLQTNDAYILFYYLN
jgi:ubiquitin C-terminal hydrolase